MHVFEWVTFLFLELYVFIINRCINIKLIEIEIWQINLLVSAS